MVANQASSNYIENPGGPLLFERDTLVKIPPNPEKGFNFAYYLWVPAGIKGEPRTTMYVEPNNTGIQSDDLSVHDKAARNFIESSYSYRIAKRLRSPMLVPVFPRPSTDWQTYTHYLNRRTMKISEGPLKRLDLQLVAMIEDARTRLEQSNIKVFQKVFMNGFSSSAAFTLRFAAIHPYLIQAAAAGGINALPILPLKKWKGKPLAYPVGVGDLKELTGEEFDSSAFLKIPQKLYMGALDTNDTVPFRDAWDEDEANFIQRNLGEKMQPDRWEKVQKIYKSTGANVTLTTYPGVAHKVTPEIEEDIFQFFSACRSVAQVSDSTAGPTVHNLAPKFLEYWNRVEAMPINEKLRILKTEIFPSFPEFYQYKIENWKKAGKDPDAMLKKQLEDFSQIKQEFITKSNEITSNLESTMKSFVAAIPGLDKNFEVYVVHSFGEMDGGTRKIGDKLYFIMGIDGMVNYHKGFDSEIPFFHHELFHVYHGQYLREEQILWIALWAEGLATYASQQLNPKASTKDLMLDMPEGMIEEINKSLDFHWRDLSSKLSSTSDEDYESYFLVSSKNKKIVKRAGYYLGYLLAREIGKNRSLTEMAKMNPNDVLPLLRKTIDGMKSDKYKHE